MSDTSSEQSIEIRPDCLERCEKVSYFQGFLQDEQENLANLNEWALERSMREPGQAAQATVGLIPLLGLEIEANRLSADQKAQILAHIDTLDSNEVQGFIDNLRAELWVNQSAQVAQMMAEFADLGPDGKVAVDFFEELLALGDEQQAKMNQTREASEQYAKDLESEFPVQELIDDSEAVITKIEAELGKCALCTGPVPTDRLDDNGQPIFDCPVLE